MLVCYRFAITNSNQRIIPNLTARRRHQTRTDYIDLYPNNDLNHTSAPENISGHFGLLFLRALYKFQFYFTLLYLSANRNFWCRYSRRHIRRFCVEQRNRKLNRFILNALLSCFPSRQCKWLIRESRLQLFIICSINRSWKQIQSHSIIISWSLWVFISCFVHLSPQF